MTAEQGRQSDNREIEGQKWDAYSETEKAASDLRKGGVGERFKVADGIGLEKPGASTGKWK